MGDTTPQAAPLTVNTALPQPPRTRSNRFATPSSRLTGTPSARLAHAAHEKSSLLRLVVVGLFLSSAAFLALGLAGGLYFRKSIIDASGNAVDVEFQSTSYSVTRVLTDTMSEAISVLNVLATTLGIFTTYTYDEFTHVASSVRSNIRNPILQWAPKVENASRADWEAHVSAELNGNYSMLEVRVFCGLRRGRSPARAAPTAGCSHVHFTLVQFFNGTTRASGYRSVYYPISYLEPVAGNQKAVLLDLLSNPARNASLHSAMYSAAPVLSEPLALVQFEAGYNLGVVVFVPV